MTPSLLTSSMKTKKPSSSREVTTSTKSIPVSKTFEPHSTLVGSQIVSDLPSHLALMLQCRVRDIFNLKDWELLYEVSQHSSAAYISLSRQKRGHWRIQFLLLAPTGESLTTYFRPMFLLRLLITSQRKCILNGPAYGQVEVSVCRLRETSSLKTLTKFTISGQPDKRREA